MEDQHKRNINYMRISITDRCNLRCRYCMPEEGIEKVAMSQILTYEEILRICRAAVSLGITRFKVTGGEPLVRKGCPALIAEIKAIPGVEQVTLTTNGQLLGQEMEALLAAGVDGINVSLDSLREDRFRQITGGGQLTRTLAGIDAALGSGVPTKINCLLQRDFNEDELADFAALALGEPAGAAEDTPGEGAPVAEWIRRCTGRGLDVRFIEIMPIGFGMPETGISNEAVLAKLQERYPDLVPDGRVHGNGPAVYYRRRDQEAGPAAVPGRAGAIGLISAMHSRFCESCNRIRLTSQGEIKPCLCYEDSVNLKPALAAGDPGQAEEIGDGALRQALAEAIARKPGGHTFEDRSSVEPRAMMQIGG